MQGLIRLTLKAWGFSRLKSWDAGLPYPHIRTGTWCLFFYREYPYCLAVQLQRLLLFLLLPTAPATDRLAPCFLTHPLPPNKEPTHYLPTRSYRLMFMLSSMVPLDSATLLRRAMGRKVSQARPSLALGWECPKWPLYLGNAPLGSSCWGPGGPLSPAHMTQESRA